MRIAVAALAVLALAACNQNNGQSAHNGAATSSSASASNSGGGLFPDMTNVSYRLEATMSHDGHTIAIVMIGSGHKMRMEMNGGQQTMIMDPDTQQYLTIVNQNGHLMGMRMTNMNIPDITAEWRFEMNKAHPRHTGDCAVAGEHGQTWETVDEGGANPRSFCVTSDGIPLRGTENGATVFEATSVQRGVQSASNFQPPAGVRIMDVNLGSQATADAVAKLRARMHQGGSGH